MSVSSLQLAGEVDGCELDTAQCLNTGVRQQFAATRLQPLRLMHGGEVDTAQGPKTGVGKQWAGAEPEGGKLSEPRN